MLKNVVLNQLAKKARKEAVSNVNSLCPYWHYQPVVPESVKVLKKKIQ